ncbi:MAG: hypothetical protein Q4D16_09780 [Eubacteriales bacterium]|nr:hypothetical protein [Eubacteriales bacterium]
MYVYKMLLLNRLREYKRLIRNMLFPVLSAAIVIEIIAYQMTIAVIPILKELKQVNLKGLFYINLFLLLYSFYCCFIKVKPFLVVKPVTLYLFEEKRIKKLLRLKMTGKLIKHLIITFCLSIIVNGFNFNNNFFVIQFLLFCLLENTSLLSWQIYHNKSKNKRLDKLIWTITCLTAFLSYLFPYVVILDLIIWLILLIHSLFVLDMNRPKYEAEMIFMEKILVAQNHNNTFLLSQYAEEKKLLSLSYQNKAINKKLISKYPLLWKSEISIFRLEKDKIVIGIGIFAVTFLIYRYPVFWSFPFLEEGGIRYSLLIFGMLAVFQLTVQSMLHQLDSISEKAKDGLFLPLSDKEIIIQFTIIPVAVMLCIVSMIAIILKCTLIQFLLAAGSLSVITISLFYLQLKHKKLLIKYYFVITIVILAVSFLMSYK